MRGILQVFMNVDLRNGHDGLTEIARRNGIKAKEIEAGDYICFINTAKDKLKLYAAGDVIAYVRLPSGRRLNMNVIAELPKVFTGSSINYDRALQLAIEKEMARKTKTFRAVLNG